MSASVSIQTLGYLGAATAVAMVVPQIARTYRNRALGGVSVLAWSLSALSSFTWLLYGITSPELPQIPGNVLTVSGDVIIALVVPAAISRRVRTFALAGSASVLVALAVLVAPSALAFVAFGIGIVSTLPQTARSVFRRPGTASAVSVPTWVLFGISQICWLIYALGVHDVVVAISACFILANAVVICATELRRSRSAPIQARPDEGDAARVSTAFDTSKR